jgi:hypothetical protein
MIMTPTASAGSIGHTETRRKPTAGSSTTWHSAPTRKSLGWTNTRLKSATASVRPSVYMMKASDSGRKACVTILPDCMKGSPRSRLARDRL